MTDSTDDVEDRGLAAAAWAENQRADAIAVLEKHTDPAEERNRAIAELLAPAYARASTLQLTDDESKALAAEFPDEAFRLGAGGKADLLYIEHAYLRERLNDVLGVGSAVPVLRAKWSEKFKNRSGKEGVRIYADSVLLVRGCVVGEAIGDMDYYPNDGTNFGDAVEGAKSNALRRCCKEFGVGLQVWKKGFVDGWKKRQAEGGRRAAGNGKENTADRFGDAQPDEEAHVKLAKEIELAIASKIGATAKTGKPITAEMIGETIDGLSGEGKLTKDDADRLHRMLKATVEKQALSPFDEIKAAYNQATQLEDCDWVDALLQRHADAGKVNAVECATLAAMGAAQRRLVESKQETSAAAT